LQEDQLGANGIFDLLLTVYGALQLGLEDVDDFHLADLYRFHVILLN
jgi:hypothetical protein